MAYRAIRVFFIASLALLYAGCAGSPEHREAPPGQPTAGAVPSETPADPPEAEPTGEDPPADAETGTDTAAALIAAAAELSPQATYAIRTGGSWLATVVDLDDNGRPDVCLLTVGVSGLEQAPALADLASPSRLSERVVVSEFFFEIYLGREDGLELFDTRRLGRFPVVEGLTPVELAAEDPFPLAVSARFQDASGHKDIWLVAGRNSLSTFVLEETAAIDSSVIDIDGDGIRDVLKAQDAFEQGRGYETFLTWYRWDGRNYAPHATTNIVRNLNEFLRVLEDHLVAGRYERFLRHAVPGSGSVADEDVRTRIAELFVPESEALQDAEDAEAEPPLPFASLLEEFEPARVSFPEFLENPFPEPGAETAFVAPLRTDTVGSDTHYYRTRVVMSRNPFDEEQFRLEPPR